MKIAIPTVDKKTVAENFGRAAVFAVYDTDTQRFDFIDNSVNLNASQGAGIQSSTELVNRGVEVVLSSNIGPKAFGVFESAKIKCYIANSGVLFEEVLDLWQKGKLEIMSTSKR